MQKKIIALAVAALASSAAFAQTNVTIYGIVDAGVSFDNSKVDGNQFRVQSGQSAGSRIGFKGTEDLGNGLSASFVLEQGFAVDNGQQTVHGVNGGDTAGTNTNTQAGGSFFQRQAYLALSSKAAGTVAFGRQYTPFFAAKAQSDVFGLGMGGTMDNLMGYVPGDANRLNNVAAYVSPTFAGFTATAAYSTGDENNVKDTAQSREGKTWALLGNYNNFGLNLNLAYHNARTAANGDIQGKAWILGGNYNLGMAKLHAAYSAGKAENTATNVDTAKGRVYHLGVAVPFGKNTFKVGYTVGQDRLTGNDQADAKLWGLAYEYALSKRTSAYAGYARLNNETNANRVINTATSNGLTNTVNGAGADRTSINLGIRHSF